MLSFDTINFKYPWEKFQALKTRPPVTIHTTDQDYGELCAAAYSFLTGDSQISRHAVRFLYEFSKKNLNGTLTSVWESYGHSLPVGGINAMNLLEIKSAKDETPEPIGKSALRCDAEDVWLALTLLCCYRTGVMNPMGHNAYIHKATRVMSSVITKSSFQAQNSKVSLKTVGDRLKGNAEFEILASAIDMFLNKFPHHPLKHLRLGSIITRNNGIAGIQNLHYLKTIVGSTTLCDALTWIVPIGAAAELRQMLTHKGKEEEVSDDYSYFPYMIGLKLTGRSPYSAAANPITHMIIHASGSLMGHDRSINASEYRSGYCSRVATNAAIIFLGNLRESMNPEEKKFDLTKSKEEWLSYLGYGLYTFSAEHKHALEMAIREIKHTRPKSVGDWVVKHLMANLIFEK